MANLMHTTFMNLVIIPNTWLAYLSEELVPNDSHGSVTLGLKPTARTDCQSLLDKYSIDMPDLALEACESTM